MFRIDDRLVSGQSSTLGRRQVFMGLQYEGSNHDPPLFRYMKRFEEDIVSLRN